MDNLIDAKHRFLRNQTMLKTWTDYAIRQNQAALDTATSPEEIARLLLDRLLLETATWESRKPIDPPEGA